MAMLGSYMQMIEPKFVVTAVMLNIFSALIIASVINPYKSDDTDVEINNLTKSTETKTLNGKTGKPKKVAFFQMIGDSAMDGFKIAVVVAVMLLAFISLMEAINIMFGSVGLNFKTAYWLCVCTNRILNGDSMERSCSSWLFNGD